VAATSLPHKYNQFSVSFHSFFTHLLFFLLLLLLLCCRRRLSRQPACSPCILLPSSTTCSRFAQLHSHGVLHPDAAAAAAAAAVAALSFSEPDAHHSAFIKVLFEPCCMSARQSGAHRGSGRVSGTVAPAAAAPPTVCRNFSRAGRCTYGLGCRYRHEQPSSRGGGHPASEGAAVFDLDPRTRKWLKCSGGGDAAPSLPSAGFEFTFVT
jgi:hypothetical protein